MEGRGLRVPKHRRLLGELEPLAGRQAGAQLDSLSARHEGACRLRALARAQARHVQRHGHRDVRRLPRRVQGRELLAAGLHGCRRGDLRGVGDRLAQDGRLPLGAHARRARPGVPLHGRGAQPDGPAGPLLVLVARLHPDGEGRGAGQLHRDCGAVQHVADVQRHPGLLRVGERHRRLGGRPRRGQRHAGRAGARRVERPRHAARRKLWALAAAGKGADGAVVHHGRAAHDGQRPAPAVGGDEGGPAR
mmetsp:Transcript_32272/g.101313  ORF Transcript_32272/g.101313 Transcript_32272/m.101313 type:complete len:248 (+) Transcript_32272:286-1029(+)